MVKGHFVEAAGGLVAKQLVVEQRKSAIVRKHVIEDFLALCFEGLAC